MPSANFRYNPFFYFRANIMNTRKTFLLGTAFFTLLFMALVLLGSWLLAQHSKQFAIASFLFAFGAVFGQITCLALYLKQKSHEIAAQQAMRKQAIQENHHV